MADERPIKTLGYLQETVDVDVLVAAGVTTTETDMFFTDGTTGPISLTSLAAGGGLPDAVIDAIGQTANTGALTGLAVTINGGDPTKFDVAAGTAIIWDSHTDPESNTFAEVTFAGMVAVARTTGSESPQAKITHLALNSGGTIIQQSGPFTDAQERDLAEFGTVWHPGGDGAAIVSAGPAGRTAQNLGLEHADFRKIFGVLRQSGILYFANGANKKFNRQAGSVFGQGIGGFDTVSARKDTGQVALGAITAATFFRVYRDATNGETIDGTFTDWDPAVWDDDSGVLAVFPGADNYGIARMYVGPPTTSFPNGLPVVGVPQATYKTKEDALVALTQPIEEREFSSTLIPTTWLVVNKAATDFTVVANAQFFSIPVLFRLGGGGVSAASGAPGVNDFDDLSDTPASKTADALVASDAAGTNLEYIDDLAGLNAKLIDGPVDVNTASRPPSGAASGDLADTFPGPSVAKITTTTGPTSLTIGAIADGQTLTRSGATIIGTAAGAAALPTYIFAAANLATPVTADWQVSIPAPLAPDSNNSGIQVVLFDDTTEEGAGIEKLVVPSTATNMKLFTLARAEAGPGGAVVAKLLFYEREISDNAAVTVWSSSIALTDVDLPITTEFFQLDETDKTLAAWGLTAGKTHQIEITRTATGNTLSGDLALAGAYVEFT